MVKIDLLVDEHNNLGEGPLWDVAEQKLYWIDSIDRKVFRCDVDGSNLKTWSVPADIGSMAIRRDGGAIVALDNGIHSFDFTTGAATLIVNPEPHNTGRTRLNDGKVDKQGRFVVGSMDRKETHGLGALFRLDPDHTLSVLDREIIVSNAPAFSPDGRTLYFADSIRSTIYAYDYDVTNGAASNRRVFVSTVNDLGVPDGGTVDAEGYVWSASIVGGQIVRYSPSGKIDRVVEFPVSTLTSVMFGGPNLDILYVTTMGKPTVGFLEFAKSKSVPPGKSMHPGDPGLGALFAVYGLGVKGLPEPRFAG